MNPAIPRRMIYSVIEKTILSLDKLKDKILEDEAFYCSLQSGFIPTNPEGGYTFLFFIHNNLDVSNKLSKDILSIVRKYTKKE